MKVLVMGEYPAVPGGLAQQGDLLFRGLLERGVDVHTVHLESDQEKEWYYRWFKPDVAVGVGYWGHAPYIVLHPLRHGVQPVPWLVADGYIANYRAELNSLPLILATSNWVKEVYIRDGIGGDAIEVLPVGCDTDAFVPRETRDPRIMAIREALGVAPHQVMILTVGGDAASKGAQEVMRALARIGGGGRDWKYVCKVWPQPRTESQNAADLKLARRLGIEPHVTYVNGMASRNFMPYLIGACDIYAGPSRLEGFGMPHMEAGACGKPVLGIRAMAMLDTLVHGQTALLAGVAQVNRIKEAVLGEDAGFNEGHRVVFDPPRIADYRADVGDITEHLGRLIYDPDLRQRLGEAGRRRAVELFDYRVVAKRFLEIVTRRLLGSASPLQPEPYAMAK